MGGLAPALRAPQSCRPAPIRAISSRPGNASALAGAGDWDLRSVLAEVRLNRLAETHLRAQGAGQLRGFGGFSAKLFSQSRG